MTFEERKRLGREIFKLPERCKARGLQREGVREKERESGDREREHGDNSITL